MPIRVYFEDTDAAGVVYYANYLRFMERARTEWLVSLGHALTLGSGAGTTFVVRRVLVDYLAPARLGETIDVTVRLVQLTRVQLVVQQSVLRTDVRLVEGRVDLAHVDAKTWRPTRIPDALMQTLEGFR